MLEKIQIVVDGEHYTVPIGKTIVDTLNELALEHPQVCYTPPLSTPQTCDTCIAEVNGQLVRTCSTPVEANMVIERTSEKAEEARVEAMNRLLRNHELYCTVCENNNGNCKLHNTVEMMGIEEQKYPFEPKIDGRVVDNSHPFYRYDPNQCIACGQCVEACQTVQVNETLSINWERSRPLVIWDEGVKINDSSCVGCGQCVTVCPCNALQEKSMLDEAGYLTSIERPLLNKMIDVIKDVEPPYSLIFALSDIESNMRKNQIKRTKTVCTFCGVGCSFEVWTKDRKILKIEPKYGPVNQISTCVKGKFGYDFVNDQGRLKTPLIRKGDHFVEASWEEAIAFAAEGLRRTKEQFGSDAIGVISSSKITNEENYVIQKFTRQILETNNVDNCSRYCQTPATEGLFRTVGMGGDAGTIDDIASAGLVIIIGANSAEAHPVLASRVKRAHKFFGQKLIVADLRKNEMAERADVYLHPKQGTDQAWLMGVTKYIIDQGWHDEAFITENVNYFEAYYESLTPYTLEYVEEVTGISKAQLIETARMIHEADGTCILWGMGITQNVGGSMSSAAISNLLLVTGNYRRHGAGAYPLRGHNNVQGASDMGTLPNQLPGYQKVADDEARKKFEAAYGVEISPEPGLNHIEMVEGIEKGTIQALYVVGEEMALVDANLNQAHELLSKLPFLIVQDITFSKTASYADVILPGVPSLEKEGTFTNTERRVQRLYQALPEMGNAKYDWWITQQLANALGGDWYYTHPSQIFAEMASLTPLFAQANYDVLANWGSFFWGSNDGASTPLLYTDGFNFPDKKARLAIHEWIEPVKYDAQYDLHLNNGRLLEQFHEGNMTRKSNGLNTRLPVTFVEVSPELAKERHIESGTMVRLVSPFGSVKVPALVTTRVQQNEIFLPMHTRNNEHAVNMLTGAGFDKFTNTPAFKQTKVRMEVLQEKHENPLPKNNQRNRKRHPQMGVEVERKWRRSDYESLTDLGGDH